MFAFVSQNKRHQQQAQAHVDRLTQSLQTKSFQGKLVPPDTPSAPPQPPEYALTSVLLERIRNASEDAAAPPQCYPLVSQTTHELNDDDLSTKPSTLPSQESVGHTMTIEQRLQNLERQNRLWKVGIVCLGTVLLMGAARHAIYPTIQAQKFELVDACGKTRAELTLEDGLPRLVFIQEDHSRNTYLGIDRMHNEGVRAVLSLSNPSGNHCLQMKATENSAELLLNGGKNRCINLQARSDNTVKPVIWFNDETGLRMRIDSAPDRSRLQLFDTQGNQTFNAP